MTIIEAIAAFVIGMLFVLLTSFCRVNKVKRHKEDIAKILATTKTSKISKHSEILKNLRELKKYGGVSNSLNDHLNTFIIINLYIPKEFSSFVILTDEEEKGFLNNTLECIEIATNLGYAWEVMITGGAIENAEIVQKMIEDDSVFVIFRDEQYDISKILPEGSWWTVHEDTIVVEKNDYNMNLLKLHDIDIFLNDSSIYYAIYLSTLRER